MNLEEKISLIIKVLDDLKCENIEAINVEKKTSMTNYIIIATGRSDKHSDSTAENIRKVLKENNILPKKTEGKATGWIVLDIGDILIHIFTAEERKKYSLEDLWK